MLQEDDEENLMILCIALARIWFHNEGQDGGVKDRGL